MLAYSKERYIVPAADTVVSVRLLPYESVASVKFSSVSSVSELSFSGST